jgi:hypothetical protein
LFYHWHNTSTFNYRTNRDLDVYNEKKMPLKMLNGDEDNLLHSGIIEEDGKHILLEIGDTPWLCYKREMDADAPASAMVRFDKAQQLPKRVQTIAEALITGKSPEGAEEISGVWWATPTSDTFTPPVLDPEIEASLEKGLNVLSFGFTPDECKVRSEGYGNDAVSILAPLGWDKIDNKGVHPHDSRVTKFVAAHSEWEKAIKIYTERSPMEYKGIHCRKARYNSSSRERTGNILRSSQGVFIKGEFKNTADWTTVTTVSIWYKLHSLCHVVNMKG